jgi:hypothetical protein
MPHSARTRYLRTLLSEALSATWEAVFANRPRTVILTIAGACLAIYLQRRYGGQSSEQTKDAFLSIAFGLLAYAVLFVCVFLTHFCYLTPKRRFAESEKLEIVTRSKQQREAIRNQLYTYLFGLEDRLEHLRRMDAKDVLIFDLYSPPRDDRQFIDEILDYLNKNMGLSYAREFLSSTGLNQAPNQSAYSKQVEMLNNRATRLKSIIDKY